MIFRVVARGPNGEIKTVDYATVIEMTARHDQIGLEDCSTDLTLRGFPVFRGLIGPLPDGGEVARYETAEVFEKLTKIWAAPRKKRKKVRKVLLK